MNKSYRFLTPLLVIYFLLILWFDGPFKGDELRYVAYAENITNGFYTDWNNPDLSNGPGYPIVLAPFIALNINLIFAKLLNGVFVFIGVLFFYRTLHYYTKPKYALAIALALGLYPPLLKWMLLLYSDSFAFMLVNGFIFYFCSTFHAKKKNRKTYVLASLFLGLLVLTKVVFFQVLILSTSLLVIFIFIKKKHQTRVYILLGAFLVIAPYIIYAYSVTNKLFYLGTRGGEILYHRSTPFEEEHGNWISSTVILGTKNQVASKISAHSLAKLRSNHREFYLQLQPLSNIQKDSAFKAKAIENMQNHPLKYLKNSITNVGRLFFNYPNSYRAQSLNAYSYFLSNGLLIVLMAFCTYPMFLAWKIVPIELKMILFFAFIYGGGFILLHGKPRYFTLMVPSIILSIAYVFGNVLKIDIKKPKVDSE